MLCKRKFKGCYGILISQWSDLKFAVNCLCVSSLKFSLELSTNIFFDNCCAVLIHLLSRVLVIIKQVKTFRLMHVFLVKCQCSGVQCCQHLNHSWLKWCEPREYAGSSWCACTLCMSEQWAGRSVHAPEERTHAAQHSELGLLRAPCSPRAAGDQFCYDTDAI